MVLFHAFQKNLKKKICLRFDFYLFHFHHFFLLILIIFWIFVIHFEDFISNFFEVQKCQLSNLISCYGEVQNHKKCMWKLFFDSKHFHHMKKKCITFENVFENVFLFSVYSMGLEIKYQMEHIHQMCPRERPDHPLPPTVAKLGFDSKRCAMFWNVCYNNFPILRKFWVSQNFLRIQSEIWLIL